MPRKSFKDWWEGYGVGIMLFVAFVLAMLLGLWGGIVVFPQLETIPSILVIAIAYFCSDVCNMIAKKRPFALLTPFILVIAVSLVVFATVGAIIRILKL